MSEIFQDSRSFRLRVLLRDAGVTELSHPEIFQEVFNFGQDMFDQGFEGGIGCDVHLLDMLGYDAGYAAGYADGRPEGIEHEL